MTRVALPEAFVRAPIAHRALHDRALGRPENSRAAVRAAVDAGYGIEIDLQLSSDGVAMVFHDDTLDRLTTATGAVRARTAAALGAIKLRDCDEGIPTFAEVLSIVGGRVPLLVEIKDQGAAGGTRLESAAAADLAGYAGPVAVMSFNPDQVAAMARLAPSVPRGITTWAWPPEDSDGVPPEVCARLREIPDYDRCDASFISHHWEDLARPRVAELAAHGAVILCWTIRSAQTEALARKVAANVTFEGYPAATPVA